MAFDKTPTTWIANWSEDETDITVPLATFSELTAAEADATTGDIRKIAFAIIEHLYSTYNSTLAADRPAKWTMQKTATVNTTLNKIISRYSITFETDFGTQEVREEYSNTPSSTPSNTRQRPSPGCGARAGALQPRAFATNSTIWRTPPCMSAR